MCLGMFARCLPVSGHLVLGHPHAKVMSWRHYLLVCLLISAFYLVLIVSLAGQRITYYGSLGLGLDCSNVVLSRFYT